MSCPFLEYRTAADDGTFDVARAYCTAADRFVQPLRADICNDRYDLKHDTDCEIYLDNADAVDGAQGYGSDDDGPAETDEKPGDGT